MTRSLNSPCISHFGDSYAGAHNYYDLVSIKIKNYFYLLIFLFMDSNKSLSYLLSKVPEITLGFWIIKILSTTVGETVADFLAVGV